MSHRKFAVVTDNVVDFIFEVSESAEYSGIQEVTEVEDIQVGYIFDPESQKFLPKQESE
jgi:hypothetical protein